MSRALFRLARAMVKHHLGMADDPYLAALVVTWHCNARCTFCDVWKDRSIKQELTVDDYRRLLDPLSDLAVVKVTGGEPFLRPDIGALLRYLVDERHLLVQVTSNGLLTARIVDTLARLRHPLHLCISLDGFGPFVDERRGIPGYSERVLETLRQLVDLKRRHLPGMFLAVNQTLFPDHPEQVALLREPLRAIGVDDIHYGIVHNLFDAEASPEARMRYWTKLDPDYVAWAVALARNEPFTALMRRATYRYFLAGVQNRVLRGEQRPSFRCQALSRYFRLMPNGDLVTCSVFRQRVDNLKEKSLAEACRGEAVQAARRQVVTCPGCWFGCEVVPNATISGAIFKGLFYRLDPSIRTKGP
ncbi:MAG: radical SAM protein [Magnetococcales bacterium]|nr:radical SAM protein [Magnetococcales bacterium]